MFQEIRSKSNLISASKEAKENSSKTRKKNILYLMLKHLQDEGLFKTADSLIVETHLNDEYHVCDNVDLDIIVQEYCNYFSLKYNKQACICKKNSNATGELLKLTSNNKKAKKPTHVDQITTQQNDSPPKERNETLSDSVKINKIKIQGNNEKFNNETRPLHIFLSNVPNELKAFAECVYQESTSQLNAIEWNDVKGLENAKMYLNEASIAPNKFPDLFTDLTSPWKGILLHGPPGGGKTLLAKAVAYESNRMLFNVTPNTLLSKWRGDSEKHIKILFDLARFYAPSIIFVDEIEALASKRDSLTEHEASRRMKCQLLIELDGIFQHPESVLFLATSNLPWEIDHALIRRMEKRIHIPLPDNETRMEIFKHILCKTGVNTSTINFTKLSINTMGYSGSDIRTVCKEAAMSSIRKLMADKSKDYFKSTTKMITEYDLELAISKIKPSVKVHADYEKWNENFGTK